MLFRWDMRAVRRGCEVVDGELRDSWRSGWDAGKVGARINSRPLCVQVFVGWGVEGVRPNIAKGVFTGARLPNIHARSILGLRELPLGLRRAERAFKV